MIEHSPSVIPIGNLDPAKKLTELSFILHREYRKTDSIVGTDAQYKDDRVAARLLFFTDGLLVSSELVAFMLFGTNIPDDIVLVQIGSQLHFDQESGQDVFVQWLRCVSRGPVPNVNRSAVAMGAV